MKSKLEEDNTMKKYTIATLLFKRRRKMTKFIMKINYFSIVFLGLAFLGFALFAPSVFAKE